MKTLVVARYKENVDWTSRVQFDVRIYNKFFDESIRLPNIGREANTYLFHILTWYDQIDDVTIFSQGDPFAHSTDFLNQINIVPENFDGFMPIGNAMIGDLPVGIHGPTAIGIRTGEFYTKIFNRPYPDTFLFMPGAQFAVSRRCIQSKPYSFYLNLYRETIDDRPSYEVGHILERLWPHIFV